MRNKILEEHQGMPHRGRFLKRLGLLSLVLGCVSVLFFPMSIAALPLSGIVCLLTIHDLRRMKAGTMAHAGKECTVKAQDYALAGLCLGLFGPLLAFCCLGPISFLRG
jgi:hypothetical protein